MSEIQHVVQADLYSLNIERLLDMARSKGVNFPIGYVLPYIIVEGKGDTDRFYRYGLEDLPKTWEETKAFIGEPGENKKFTMFSVKCRTNYFRNFLVKANAEKDCESLNKRHVIVAMQSDNPKFPVLI
jgi:hypothetical protein